MELLYDSLSLWEREWERIVFSLFSQHPNPILKSECWRQRESVSDQWNQCFTETATSSWAKVIVCPCRTVRDAETLDQACCHSEAVMSWRQVLRNPSSLLQKSDVTFKISLKVLRQQFQYPPWCVCIYFAFWRKELIFFVKLLSGNGQTWTHGFLQMSSNSARQTLN